MELLPIGIGRYMLNEKKFHSIFLPGRHFQASDDSFTPLADSLPRCVFEREFSLRIPWNIWPNHQFHETPWGQTLHTEEDP